MSRDPSGNITGGNGLGDYSGNPDLRSPALGRSSRDLASDTGPAGASDEMFTAGDPDTGLLSGRSAEPTPDPGARADRPKKFNPDIDPDARLGLPRPAIAGDAAPDLDPHPIHDTRTRAATAAVAGLLGAAVLATLMYALYFTGVLPVPTFVAAERAWLGGGDGTRSPTLDHLLATVGFLVAGALWGALFGLLVRRPSALYGMLFGLLPTLFLWLVIAPTLPGGRPFMGFTRQGILLPLLFNVAIWGSIVGSLCARWLGPPRSSATAPPV